MVVKLRSCKPFLALMMFFIPAVLSAAEPLAAQTGDPQCSEMRNRWEQVTEDLKNVLQTYIAIQGTPVERLAQRPVVGNAPGITIAHQISEAMQVKEDLLNAKRGECRNLINLENQAFERLQECLRSARSSKTKDFANLSKKRRAFIDKCMISVAEVTEVEGQETEVPYQSAGQDPYTRSVNNYWQNYQQMYRGWWGR